MAGVENEPGAVSTWQNLSEVGKTYAEAGVGGLERWYGTTADRLLLEHGLMADAESRARLLDELHRAFTMAADLLKTRAEGDYSPDPNAKRFPDPETVKGKASKEEPLEGHGLTFAAVIDAEVEKRALGRDAVAASQDHRE